MSPSAERTSGRLRALTMTALFAAILAVICPISIPIGAIPITFSLLVVYLAGGLLGPGLGTLAVLVYLALGAVGLPVFSGMQGGLAKLMGPTGGFLWGYLVGVAVACVLLAALRRAGFGSDRQRGAASQVGKSDAANRGVIAFLRSFGAEILAGVVFTAVAYVCGTFQFTLVMNASVTEALAACVLPFVAIDVAKIVVAVIAADAVRAVIRR